MGFKYTLKITDITNYVFNQSQWPVSGTYCMMKYCYSHDLIQNGGFTE